MSYFLLFLFVKTTTAKQKNLLQSVAQFFEHILEVDFRLKGQKFLRYPKKYQKL